MIYQIKPNQEVKLTIYARDFYSRNCIELESNKIYQIISIGEKYWWDWFIPCSASGYSKYFNPLVILIGLRLKHVNCFCLCGVFDKNEKTKFKIGKSKELCTNKNKILYFFANDHKKAYWNNWGKIEISIKNINKVY